VILLVQSLFLLADGLSLNGMLTKNTIKQYYPKNTYFKVATYEKT